MLKSVRLWATGIVAVGLVVWIVVSSQSFQSCINQSKDQASEQAFQKGPSDLVISLIRRINFSAHCVGEFIDNNNEAITAISTLFIALFTLTLWVSTTGTLKLAREEFNSAHRPKLRVRRIEPFLSPWIVRYEVTNVGDTPAMITRHDIVLFVKPSDDEAKKTIIPVCMECRRMAPGQYLICETKLAIADDDEYALIWNQATDNGTLNISGVIVYADALGILRRTKFLRTYDGKTGRFRKSDDPEDEYED
jgi:hypothetical protein